MASFSKSTPALEQLITKHKFSPFFSDQLWCLARNDSSLTTLNLSSNEIGYAGVAAIAHALSSNSTLTILDLGDNRIGPTGSTTIAHSLTSNSFLTTLGLYSNKIGYAGAI